MAAAGAAQGQQQILLQASLAQQLQQGKASRISYSLSRPNNQLQPNNQLFQVPLFNPLSSLPFGPQDIQQLQQHIQQQQQNLQNLQKMLLLQSGQLNPAGLQALLL